MPDPAAHAVFLSYASQDAEAALRIAEALRATGVEVWFDKDELVGGDAWDAKIRGQIANCALFVPVISAATQARGEGYFRLEWKLAAQRTHMISERTPFLLPVVIDATGDREADVPGEFRAVQWTRLRGGETPPAFSERVQALLGGSEMEKRRPRSVQRDEDIASSEKGRLSPASMGRAFHARLAWRAGAILACAVAVLVGRAWWMRNEGASSPTSPMAVTSPPKTEKSTLPDATVRVSEKSVAVLPFENRSPEKDSEFFADGVHEDVLTNLSYIRDLTVVPRIVAMRFRGTTLRPRELGAELRVAHLVYGTVRRVGNTVRITSQLIDAHSEAEKRTWQRDYELTSDVMAIQTALATAIAGELRAALSPQEQKLLARRPTESVEAYDVYLRLRAKREAQTTASPEHYVEFEAQAAKAVELDPKFAEAWAELARVRSSIFHYGYDQSPALVAKCITALETAQRLAPDSPEVILVRGEVNYRMGRNYARAILDYERILQLQPRNPEVYQMLGVVQRRQGKWREALVSTRKAVEIDPKYVTGWVNIWNSTALGRRFEEALEARRRIAQLEPNTFHLGRPGLEVMRFGGSPAEFKTWRANLAAEEADREDVVSVRRNGAILLAEYDEALRLDSADAPPLTMAWILAFKSGLPAARARLAEPAAEARRRLTRESGNAALWSTLGQMEAMLGNGGAALAAARRAVELMSESRDAIDGPTFCHNLAMVRAWTGDKDGALGELARLLGVPGTQIAQNVPLTVHAMRRDPRYAPLWGDPRFEALLNDPKNNAPLF